MVVANNKMASATIVARATIDAGVELRSLFTTVLP
jgi:hypothetical protein